jgi:hypothetical protein
MLNILLSELVLRRCQRELRARSLSGLIWSQFRSVIHRNGRRLYGLVCNWGYWQLFGLNGGFLGDFMRRGLVRHSLGLFDSWDGFLRRFGRGRCRLGRGEHAGPRLLRDALDSRRGCLDGRFGLGVLRRLCCLTVLLGLCSCSRRRVPRSGLGRWDRGSSSRATSCTSTSSTSRSTKATTTTIGSASTTSANAVGATSGDFATTTTQTGCAICGDYILLGRLGARAVLCFLGYFSKL